MLSCEIETNQELQENEDGNTDTELSQQILGKKDEKISN